MSVLSFATAGLKEPALLSVLTLFLRFERLQPVAAAEVVKWRNVNTVPKKNQCCIQIGQFEMNPKCFSVDLQKLVFSITLHAAAFKLNSIIFYRIGVTCVITALNDA